MEKVTEPRYKSHNKISNNKTYILFPRGIKYYLYFTLKNNSNVCLLYDKNKKYIKNVYVSFNISLSEGTIMYGTLNNNTFVIENLLLYKNKKIQNNIYNLDLILYILKYEINERSIKETLKIKIPYMTNTKCIYSFSNISYSVYSVVEYNTYNMFLLKKMFGNFIIKKDKNLLNVYNLYLLINNEEIYYSNACINDIKTTFLVNKLFKNNINYNTNEYSEDENEEDEILHVYITCLYIPEVKGWKPYLENRKKIIDSIDKIKLIEMNYN